MVVPAAPLITLEYHRPGKGVTTFAERLVLDRPDLKVLLLLEAHAGETVHVGDAVALDAGAPVVWFVFPGKWHDVGRFHRADGTFTGYYTNLVTPVEMHGDRWVSRDLFLDLWQPADGEPSWLDEDELAAAVRQGHVDAATRQRILNERASIDFQLRRGAWPPGPAVDIDLRQARELLGDRS